jgi:drug/metabolite transporter (DMT)-like permease
VYPVARGGAPLVVLALAAAAGTTPSWAQGAAVALVLAGVLLVGGVRRAGRRALGFGAAIAVCIAGYTLVDKHGVRHAGPIPYLELVMLGPTVLYAGAIVRAKGAAAVRAAVGPGSVVAGLATFVAYALVLAALQRAPAASVAAVRETGVVIAALLAAVVLRERVGPARLAGAVLVAGGVALLALS